MSAMAWDFFYTMNDNPQIPTFTNKTLVKTYKDSKGRTVMVTSEVVQKMPKSPYKKALVDLKLRIEKLVDEKKICAYYGNKLFKIAKQDKKVYKKKYHWYIGHTLCAKEIEDFVVTKQVVLDEIRLLMDVYGDNVICVEANVRKELLELLKDKVLTLIMKSVMTWEDDLKAIGMNEQAINHFKIGYRRVIADEIESYKQKLKDTPFDISTL